jgi:hypothetical protein
MPFRCEAGVQLNSSTAQQKDKMQDWFLGIIPLAQKETVKSKSCKGVRVLTQRVHLGCREEKSHCQDTLPVPQADAGLWSNYGAIQSPPSPGSKRVSFFGCGQNIIAPTGYYPGCHWHTLSLVTSAR